MGDQHSAMTSELQSFVEFNGKGEAEVDGSLAAIHRIWINIRGKINDGDPHVVLM
ncbi:MAG: hypothetical protein R3C53_21915 [Pirellulaceae bacterium]